MKLTPTDYMTSFYFDRRHRDTFAFLWLNKIMGIYKSKAMIYRLKKYNKK